jgi:hypothetical protein
MPPWSMSLLLNISHLCAYLNQNQWSRRHLRQKLPLNPWQLHPRLSPLLLSPLLSLPQFMML